MNFDIRRFKVLDSTSTYLKALAEKGEKEGVVIVADAQTKGRGRQGKSFFSPNGTGLYMSLLLKPSLSPEKSLFITTAAAVALSRAIEALYPHKAKIKWVNDVYINDRKAAGILTEASYNIDGSLKYIILGIGVNISTDSFPKEIEDIAISLGKEDLRESLLANILSEFSLLYEAFPSLSFFEEYKSRSMLLGREIEILGEKSLFGTAVDIDNECHLLVKLNTGETVSLSSGEVSTKLKGLVAK